MLHLRHHLILPLEDSQVRRRQQCDNPHLRRTHLHALMATTAKRLPTMPISFPFPITTRTCCKSSASNLYSAPQLTPTRRSALNPAKLSATHASEPHLHIHSPAPRLARTQSRRKQQISQRPSARAHRRLHPWHHPRLGRLRPTSTRSRPPDQRWRAQNRRRYDPTTSAWA